MASAQFHTEEALLEEDGWEVSFGAEGCEPLLERPAVPDYACVPQDAANMDVLPAMG